MPGKNIGSVSSSYLSLRPPRKYYNQNILLIYLKKIIPGNNVFFSEAHAGSISMRQLWGIKIKLVSIVQ